MRPSRVLGYLLVAVFVALGLSTPESEGVASAEPVLAPSDQPRMVGTAPIGTIDRRQVFQLLVNRRLGEAIVFGYQSYIHGLDEEDLYAEGSGELASRALITFYIEGRIARVHRNGPFHVYEVIGKTSVFYDATPDGDFSDPETFRNGTQIAAGEVNVVYTFEPRSGDGLGDVRLTQVGAWPFEFKGELIQFGEGGNHTASWRGKTKTSYKPGWIRVFGTATAVQGAPSP